MCDTLAAEMVVRKQQEQEDFLHAEKWVILGRYLFLKESGFV